MDFRPTDVYENNKQWPSARIGRGYFYGGMKMNREYDLFIKEILEELRKLFEEEAEIAYIEPQKNNGVIRAALHIYREGKQLGAVYYLDSYFIQYCQGNSVKSLAEKIQKNFLNQFGDKLLQIPEIGDFKEMQDKIVFRLVNAKMNWKLLENVPHIKILDLAVVFCIYLGSCEMGEMTAVVHNNHLAMWKETKEMLYQCAVKNTPQILPACFNMMEEAFREMAEEMKVNGFKDFDVDSFLECDMVPLGILTNRQKMYGAGTILYEGELRRAAERMGETLLLVIPSSVHETILAPLEEKDSLDSMKGIINSINRKEVPKEDWLSNHAYVYHREMNRIGWISDDGEIREWYGLEQFYAGCFEKGDDCHD